MNVEGAHQALEDRHPAHRDEALGDRVGQGRQAAAESGGEQHRGPHLDMVGRGIVKLHVRSSILKGLGGSQTPYAESLATAW